MIGLVMVSTGGCSRIPRGARTVVGPQRQIEADHRPDDDARLRTTSSRRSARRHRDGSQYDRQFAARGELAIPAEPAEVRGGGINLPICQARQGTGRAAGGCGTAAQSGPHTHLASRVSRQRASRRERHAAKARFEGMQICTRRPAARDWQIRARREFDADVLVTSGGETVGGRSSGLMMLSAAPAQYRRGQRPRAGGDDAL